MIYTYNVATNIIQHINNLILKNINKKIYTEFILCKKIINTHNKIFNELTEILKEENGNNYTIKLNKHKKHFPSALNLPYDEYINKHTNTNTTYSLSSKPINEQIYNFLLTAMRRHNMTNMYQTDNNLLEEIKSKYILKIPLLIPPIEYQNNLMKYEGDEIRYHFTEFVDNGRLFYDIIYTIKTENPHLYLNIDRVMQDTILICKINSTNTYHIMYSLDNNISSQYPALKREIINTNAKNMYENKSI